MSTELVINRVEVGEDKVNRPLTILTEVLNVTIGYDTQYKITQIIDENKEGVEFVNSNNTEFEVYGNVVLRILDLLETIPNFNLSREWLEDGVNSEGKFFNVSEQVYSMKFIS